MKLSDLKLADFQNAASRVDFSDTLTRLAIVGLLPFVVCLTILFTYPDLQTKLVTDSLLVAVILWAGGGALIAGLRHFEERRAGDQSTGTRSLFDAGVAVLASIVTVALIYLVSQIGR
jgi:hypothetical protein